MIVVPGSGFAQRFGGLGVFARWDRWGEGSCHQTFW